jgi:hypothetical protein
MLRNDFRPFQEPMFLIAIAAAVILLGGLGVLAAMMQ